MARLVAIGVVSGFVSALLGVGGGIVIVPLLMLWGGLDLRRATATSLAAIGITAVAGVATYWALGDIRPGYAALVGLPAAVGAVARHLAPGPPPRAPRHLPLRRAPGRRRGLAARVVTGVLAALVGLLAGVLAGMFGVGGGILFVPALLALGLGAHEAIGTSLLAIIPAVAAGTWRNTRAGNVRWREAGLVGVAAVVSAQLGVARRRVASRARPPEALRGAAPRGRGADRAEREDASSAGRRRARARGGARPAAGTRCPPRGSCAPRGRSPRARGTSRRRVRRASPARRRPT